MSFYRKQQLKYIITDTVSAIVVWSLFLVFRWMVYEGILFSVDTILVPLFRFWTPFILYPLGCLITYYLSGYYMRPVWHSKWKELQLTFVSSLIITFVAFFLIIIDDPTDNYRYYYGALIALFVIQFTVSYLPRLCVTLSQQHRIRTGEFRFNTAMIVATADQRPRTTEKIVAYIPFDDLANFAAWKKEYHIDRVIINLGKKATEEQLYEVINRVYPHRVEIAFPARVYDLLTGAAQIHNLWGNPLVVITDCNMSDSELCIKRAFDMGTSALGLILLSPLFLIITILVKLDSQGPVIYKQERVGHYGRVFNILKFRTMQADAETSTPQLSQQDDPRITRLGKTLRKYRLDELPQLWNVLRGDMSIVGPRPERQYFINQIVEKAPYYCLLYKIRPGLTSWGPVRVGYTDTIDKMIDRLNYDMAYMENMSLLLDVKIMLFTVKVIVDGKGQ